MGLQHAWELLYSAVYLRTHFLNRHWLDIECENEPDKNLHTLLSLDPNQKESQHIDKLSKISYNVVIYAADYILPSPPI